MVSRRPPLKGMWERMTPSGTNPHRAAPRWQASLSGAQVSSSRARPSVVNPYAGSSRTAVEATPLPRACGASHYPIMAVACPWFRP
jgi:hypothetical protein